jgi:hypothetical protein
VLSSPADIGRLLAETATVSAYPARFSPDELEVELGLELKRGNRGAGAAARGTIYQRG